MVSNEGGAVKETLRRMWILMLERCCNGSVRVPRRVHVRTEIFMPLDENKTGMLSIFFYFYESHVLALNSGITEVWF